MEPDDAPEAAMPQTPSSRGGSRAAHTPSGRGSVGSFPATPAVDRLTAIELRSALKDAWRLVREKERDCALAAEIGSKLLEANEQLKAEYNRVLEDYESALARQPAGGDAAAVLPTPPASQGAGSRHRAPGEDLTVNHLFELERINQELQQRLDSLAFANAELERANLIHDKKAKDLEAAHKEELSQALVAIRELEADKAQLAREKAEILKQVKEGKKLAGTEAAYAARIDELESLAEELAQRADHAEGQLDGLRQEAESWALRCRELEERCDGMETLRDENVLQHSRIDELEGKLADERDLVANLKAILNGEKNAAAVNLAAVDVFDDDENAHSLFSEVEDRRQALESRHNQLTAKHKGLMRVHHQNVHQQERMRNHISRLTQLTQSRTDEERLHRLEQALGEKDSENRALVARIAALERGGASAEVPVGMDNGIVGAAAPSASDAQTLQTLRLRLSTLESECEFLRGELRTMKMLRVGEIEKLRKTERALGEKEEEIERLRNEAAKWKWEAEEAKVLLEEKEQLSNLVSETVIEDAPAVSGTERRTRRHIASQTDQELSPLDVEPAPAELPQKLVLASAVALDTDLPELPRPAAPETRSEPDPLPAADSDSPAEFTIRSVRHEIDSDTSSSSAGSMNMENTFSNVTSASLKTGHTQTRSLLVAVTTGNMKRGMERTPNSQDAPTRSPASPLDSDPIAENASSGGAAAGPTPIRTLADRNPLSEIPGSALGHTLSAGPRRQRVPTAERVTEDPPSTAPGTKRLDSVPGTGLAPNDSIGAAAGGRAPKQVFVNKKAGGSAPSSADARKQEAECKQQ